MVEPLLAVDNVSCWFGGLKAVDGASLSAPPDRITALIGPNGAGKTTLFSIISGFVRAHEGTIRYAGAEITGKLPHELARRGIARTFQIVQPFVGLSVRENILVGAHLHHRARDAAVAGCSRYLAWATDRVRNRAPVLLLTCGLSGSGKTWLARQLRDIIADPALRRVQGTDS